MSFDNFSSKPLRQELQPWSHWAMCYGRLACTVGRVSGTQEAMVCLICRLFGGIVFCFFKVIKLKHLQSFQTNVCKSVGERKNCILYICSSICCSIWQIFQRIIIGNFWSFPSSATLPGVQLLVWLWVSRLPALQNHQTLPLQNLKLRDLFWIPSYFFAFLATDLGSALASTLLLGGGAGTFLGFGSALAFAFGVTLEVGRFDLGIAITVKKIQWYNLMVKGNSWWYLKKQITDLAPDFPRRSSKMASTALGPNLHTQT